jgi:hypothetical protein
LQKGAYLAKRSLKKLKLPNLYIKFLAVLLPLFKLFCSEVIGKNHKYQMTKLAERYKCSKKGFIEETSSTKLICKLDQSKAIE